MLSVLDLFSRAHTTMTAEQIAEAMGLTRTTCYRYTRELSHAGLLVSDGGLFMLGPRIIELDRRIIESDPLLNAGRPVITALADSLGAKGLLTTSYDDRVINIFEHMGSLVHTPLSFGRGTTMPLFRSSTSKVILASMSRSRLMRLWRSHQDEPDCQAIGKDWISFWKNLQIIKRQGYWTSAEELDAGMAGISAPILFGTGEVAGSMSLVFTAEDFKIYDMELLAARLRGAASKVSHAVATSVGETASGKPSKSPAREQQPTTVKTASTAKAPRSKKRTASL